MFGPAIRRMIQNQEREQAAEHHRAKREAIAQSGFHLWGHVVSNKQHCRNLETRASFGDVSCTLLRYSGGGLGRGLFAQDASLTQPPLQPSPGVPEEGERKLPKL